MAKLYELRIETSEFKRALDVMSTVVNKKVALPILSNVLVSYQRERKTFRLTAGNSEQWIEIDALKPIDGDTGEYRPWLFLDGDDRNAPFEAVCINLAAMKEAFAVLPTMPVRAWIDLENSSMRVNYGKGEFTMPVNTEGTPDQYPPIPQVVEKDGEQRDGIAPVIKFSIETMKMLPVVGSARCCAANDELRPVMNTVCLDCFHDHLIIVSSDGHALYRSTLDTGMGWLRYGEFPADQSAKLLLPSQALSPIVKALADKASLTLTADSQRIQIESTDGQVRLMTCAIEGKYPNYDSAIPKDNPHRLLLDRSELLTTLRRVRIFSEEASNMCILRRADEHLMIRTADTALGRNAEEQVKIINPDTTLPDGQEVGCKISTIEMLLGCISTDNVLMELGDPDRPILFREDLKVSPLTLLAMPMLVNN